MNFALIAEGLHDRLKWKLMFGDRTVMRLRQELQNF